MRWLRAIGNWVSRVDQQPDTEQARPAIATESSSDDASPMSPSTAAPQGTYASDAPIESPEADKFHRRPFAERIAEALAHRTDPESIVVGIYGAWGQGKTSVLNLINHRLKSYDGIKVLRFNPWRYQNEDQILVAFFEAVAHLLNEQLYTWLERQAKTKFVQGVGKGAKSAPYGEGASEIVDLLSSVEVEQLKQRIEEKLLHAKTRIVVLVDDIDRLDKNEVYAIFRLVKLTANLKYVSFILAFDEEVVSEALQERYATANKEAGKAFLQKIIQVPLELPLVQPTVLRAYCLEGIDRALKDSGHTLTQEEARRFVGAFDEGLFPMIRTPRDVMRYHNALTFTLPILKGDLNAVDMMHVEGIRVFFPSVYEKMRLEKNIFLSSRGLHESLDTARTRTKPMYDEVFEGLSPQARKACEELIGALFPSLKGALTGWHENVDQKQAALDKRIASPRYYDRYFMLNIPKGDISDSRIEGIMSLAQEANADIESIKQAIQKALSDADAEVVIYKLRLRTDDLGASTARTLGLALCQIGDSLPNSTIFFGIDGPRRQTAWMISGLLEQIANKEERIGLAKEILRVAEPIAFGVEVLYSIPTQQQDPKPEALTREEKLEIGQVLQARFSQLADSGEMFSKSIDDIGRIINAWNSIGDAESLSKHLTNRVRQHPEFASRLITIVRPTAQTMGLPGTSKEDLEYETYQFILKLVPLDVMLASIKETHGDAAEPSMEWPRSRRGDDDDLRSAQQFLWRNIHNTKPVPAAES